MTANNERCFGQQVLEWEECPGKELTGNRSRILGNLVCDKCFRCAALEDPLTGLPNRHSLAGEFKDFTESGQQFGALLIDLSSFKHVNDTHGHVAGDKMLIHTAKFFEEKARKSDGYFVGRQGGDEFVVLARLENRRGSVLEPEEMLKAAGDRLASVFSDYEPISEYNASPNVPENKRLGMRFGYAVWSEGMSLEDLLDLADVDKSKAIDCKEVSL